MPGAADDHHRKERKREIAIQAEESRNDAISIYERKLLPGLASSRRGVGRNPHSPKKRKLVFCRLFDDPESRLVTILAAFLRWGGGSFFLGRFPNFTSLRVLVCHAYSLRGSGWRSMPVEIQMRQYRRRAGHEISPAIWYVLLRRDFLRGPASDTIRAVGRLTQR